MTSKIEVTNRLFELTEKPILSRFMLMNVSKVYLAAFLAKMNQMGNTKLQNMTCMQSMMPPAQLYAELFPGQRIADCLTELFLHYVDNSWLKFWPVEMEKKIFRVATRDLEEQHIRFLKEFKEQSTARKLGQSDIKSILMLKFEPHSQSPNKLILIEILLLHKLSILNSTLQEDNLELFVKTLTEVGSLTKVMMYYLDFEFAEDLMAQRRCQYTYITILVSVFSTLVDIYGQLETKESSSSPQSNLQTEEGCAAHYEQDSEISYRDLVFLSVRDILDFLKLCLTISYLGNKSLFDEAPKSKSHENRFFSAVATGGKPEDSKPICAIVAKQILKIIQRNEDFSTESQLKLEPILKKPQKVTMFGAKRVNFPEISTGIDASTSAASDKGEFLIDKEEVLLGLPNVYSRDDKIMKFLNKGAALNTHEIRQQYLSRLSINSLQLRADFNEYLTLQRTAISDNIDTSLRLDSHSSSRRLKVSR